MKKKLFISIVMLVAAALLLTGCSEDALKDRVPGVKANVNMLLADNIDETVGEIETEQELDSVNFGEDLVIEVESQLEEVSTNTELKTNLVIPDDAEGTYEETVKISFSDASSLKEAVELINFESGDLVVNLGEGVSLLKVNHIVSDDGKSVSLNGESLNLSNDLIINYEIDLATFDDSNNKIIVEFANPAVESVQASFDNLTELGQSNDFDTAIEASTIIDNYDRPDELDSIDENKTKLHLNFDLPQGVIMDFAPASGNDIEFVAEGNNKSFTLKSVIDINNSIKGDSNNSASIELFEEFYDLLDDPDTTLVKISGGEFDLSSDGSVIIDKTTKIGMKSITLSEFALNDKGIEVEPQTVETLDEEEIEDVKKGLENIKLIIEGITNELEADISIQPYLASLPNYSGDEPANMNAAELDNLKESLYVNANKLVDAISISPNTTNSAEEVIIGHDEMDRFTGEDLFFGVVIQIPELNIDNAENSNFVIEKVYTELNINLEADDLDE